MDNRNNAVTILCYNYADIHFLTHGLIHVQNFYIMSKGELIIALKQFTGTTQWYYHPLFKAFNYTDGVRFLAINAEAYWLIEFIFSHQLNPKIKALEFQVWNLVKKENGCTITVEDGNDNVIATFNLNSTDFPLEKITLWLEESTTLLLPSEH